MEIVLTESQLRRADILLASKNIKNHDMRGLKLLLGRHEGRKPAELGKEFGITEYGVTKRCRDVLKSGVDRFLADLELGDRVVDRARKLLPDDDAVSLAQEFGIPERRVRYLVESNQLSLPSNRGIQTIEDLLRWTDSKNEPVLDLAGISLSGNGAVAVLALQECTKNHAHYRGFLDYDVAPAADWTELSTQDRRFAKAFGLLRKRNEAFKTPGAIMCEEFFKIMEFLERVRKRFPLPFSLVVIVDSETQAEQLAKLTSRGERVAVHCCSAPIVDWLERYFYTVRLQRSSLGLAPNLGGLCSLLLRPSDAACFEWIGCANNAENVIRHRFVASLFHAAQGHIHELSPWLWPRMRRANTVPLVTYRWQTKVQDLTESSRGDCGIDHGNDIDPDRVISISPLPGIAYLIRLTADAASKLRGDLRGSSLTKRFYLTNGLDGRGATRPHHVFCNEHELERWKKQASTRKEYGGCDTNPGLESPGSAAVLLTRHLLFPSPPGHLHSIASVVAEVEGSVGRQIVSTAEGSQDCLIFCPPDLLQGIHDAFCSEVYADLIVAATCWEEQSVSNLCSIGVFNDEAFFESMVQINDRLPILRPGASTSETEERWQNLFCNCDADFLISGISEKRKQEIEKQLDQWTEAVTALIAEAYTISGSETLNVIKVAGAAPAAIKGALNRQIDFSDCFQGCIASFATTQRRVVRRAIETCARMAIAGLPPLAIAIVPIKEILAQFRRELRSHLRAARSGTAKQSIAPLLEERAKTASEDAAPDIAELLVEAGEMLSNPTSAESFWDQLDELSSAGRSVWEYAIDLLEIDDPGQGQIQALEKVANATVPHRTKVSEPPSHVIDWQTPFEKVIFAYLDAVAIVRTFDRMQSSAPEDLPLWGGLADRQKQRAERGVAARRAAIPELRQALAASLGGLNISMPH